MWGCQTYDLKPDMIACAKGLSGMQPISALLINDKIRSAPRREQPARRLRAWLHLCGHPVATAVAPRPSRSTRRWTSRRSSPSRASSCITRRSGFPPLVGQRRAAPHQRAGACHEQGEQGPFPAEANLIGRSTNMRQFGIILRSCPTGSLTRRLIIDEASLDEMGAARARFDATLEG